MTRFSDLLTHVAAKFSSKRELARVVGISAPRLSRALKGEDGYSFNIENCLRLAEASGESASDILRAADKGDVADLLERLYGSARQSQLPSDERELLARWRQLSADAKQDLKNIIWRLTETRVKAKRPA